MADYRKIRAQEHRSYLASFPEEVYNLNDNSHIVRLLDALCGDSGVGGLRDELFMMRMQTALSETRFFALDQLYSYALGLPRLPSEKYDYETSSLLVWQQQQEMQIKDAHYRGRINKYMMAYQYGGTEYGIQLAAEAALGLECRVMSCKDFYQSRGVPDGTTWENDEYPMFGQDKKADYSEYVVIVLVNRDLTVDESYSVYMVTRRIRPVDSTITVKTLGELSEAGIITAIDDEPVEVASVTSSSDWWNVLKYVTGRLDWDSEKYPDAWVEPCVRKEAPRQLMMNVQEDVEDFTSMVKSVEASSQHIGYYGKQQRLIFASLANLTDEMLAKYSLSAAAAKKYTRGYFGGDYVIDWSYPSSCLPAMTPFYQEHARSHRFWSSKESYDGDEWLEYELKKILPLNRIDMNISRKPVRIVPYVSSTIGENGEREWRRLKNEDGVELAYTTRTWGGSSIAGDMIGVSFVFQTIQADAIKFEFERLDVPYLKTVGEKTYEELSFPWSIEVADVAFTYEIRQRDDFVSATYTDMFGNQVDLELREMKASNAIDGDETSYWVSQPNLGESAVEYLILDFGEVRRINYLDIESIYDGCQMNVYSSDDGVVWTPYPEIFTLISDRFMLPERKTRYMKLEFTMLNAIPYQVCVEGIKVHTRQFPNEVKASIGSDKNDSRVTSLNEKLLMQPTKEGFDVYSSLGIADAYANIEHSKISAFDTGYSALVTLFTSDAYRRTADTSIMAKYGEAMVREKSLRASLPSVTPVEQDRFKYRFTENVPHEYYEEDYERELNLAYVVGIKDIVAGYHSESMSFALNESAIINAFDDRLFAEKNQWGADEDERLRPLHDDVVCSLETNDIQTLVPFRSFDFTVNQKPPKEVFDYPSDMAIEWHGFGGAETDSVDFGVSGTVLEATMHASQTGIESERKLIRARSIANMQVDVYSPVDSEWVLECIDTYGQENVFRMAYQVDAGKWTTIGTVFTPQPGGGWWSDDYDYRIRIPLHGAISKNANVFLPIIDFDALWADGMLEQPPDDLRLIYFDGVDCREIDLRINDNMEMWFKAQQEVPAGVDADGSYHFDISRFVGAYYVYFGNSVETTEPKRDVNKVFAGHEYSFEDATKGSGGTDFTGTKAVEMPYMLSSGEGFISLEYTPDSAFVAETEYSLFDYDDDYKTVRCYLLNGRLHFEMTDKSDDFTSEYINYAEANSENQNSSLKPAYRYFEAHRRILVEWGAKGSKDIYRDGILDAEDKRRREIRVFISNPNAGADISYIELPCMNNVYDEAYYDDGTVYSNTDDKRY